MKLLLTYLLPVLLVSVASGFSFWYHQRLGRLNKQLARSVAVLQTENAYAARQAQRAVEYLEAAVMKNRNPPADVARLKRAQALHGRVVRLLPRIHALDSLLRHGANAAPNATGLRQLAQPARLAADQPAGRLWRALRQQVAACADSLRRFSPAAAQPVALRHFPPNAAGMQALASLVETQHQLLASEAAVLRQLTRAISAPRWPLAAPVVLATAERSLVAPGDTYRAELLLANHFPADLRMTMRCNGRPVPVDSLGIGRVRFRAPRRPGPAAWTGTIRTRLYGRDTTFAVRVPYRVAPR